MVIDAKPHEAATATLPGRSELGAVRRSSSATRRSLVRQGPNFAAASCCGSSRSRKYAAFRSIVPRSTAVIRYERGKLGVADLLQRLAAAIRGARARPVPGPRPSVSSRRTCRNRD